MTSKTNRGIFSNRCWLNNQLQPATVYYRDEKITEITAGKIEKPVSEFLDVGNNILMPGIIDAHVHINEPGRTEWEGFETATRAAAAGGTTTLVDMPLNSSPVTTSGHAFNFKLQASKRKLSVNCGFYGGLIPGNEDELETLIEMGVLGIKCFLIHSGIDEFPNVERETLEKAMPVLAKHQIPLLAHCELYEKHPVEADLKKSPKSYLAYLNSRPRSWENKAIDLMIALCRKYNCRTHIVHVSSSDALETIKKAKSEGLPLTAETCPQYLFFNAEDIPDGNTLFKCAPPIREKTNNQLLINALRAGVLDFITTDHSPAPPDIKELESGDYSKAWGGIAGIQSLLSASWTALKNDLSIETFIPLLTNHPAHFLGIGHQKGRIKIGMDADLLIWSPEEKFKLKVSQLHQKHKISPYLESEMFGKVKRTIVNGEIVFQNDLLSDQIPGKCILKN